MNGTCVCHPGFGDSFVHIELKPAEGDLYGIRIPTDFDLNPIPGCGYDVENDAYNDLFRGPKPADPVTGLPAMPVCEPIYVADCGDMFYTFAGTNAVHGAPLFLALAIAWLGYEILDPRREDVHV